jgi:hypothetical protein
MYKKVRQNMPDEEGKLSNLDQCTENLQGRLNFMCQKRDKQPKFLRNVICKNLTKHI